MEQTLIIIKPDAVQRGLVGAVLSRFEQRGFSIVGMKMAKLSPELLKEHYAHIANKPFFPGIASFMSSSPVVVAVIEGREAVQVCRDMCGPTNARKAAPGTIRGDFSLSTQCNVIHASDSPETAKNEVARFFKPGELHGYKRMLNDATYSSDERQ
jgi:nucleoside-diphosphate kinase